MTKEKEQKCEHCWLPILFPTDGQVFGTEEDEEVFLESDIIIVQCADCNMRGYILAERI